MIRATRSIRGIAALVTALPIVAVTAVCAPVTLALARQAANRASDSGAFGDFTLKYEQATFESGSRSTNVINMLNASMQSKRYDMSGSRIQLTATLRNVVTAATASGNVRVVARDQRIDPQTKEKINQKTIVTCDSAQYKRDAPNTTRGRIDMNGHVRTETYLSQDAPPIINQSESGYIEFLESGNYRVTLVHGNASGTVLEPTPAPSKKSGSK